MLNLKKRAFTLIELLVVIAIIGILVTIAVIALNNARAKARDAKRVADIKQVQTALELFFNDKSRYPTLDEFNSGSIYSTTTLGTTTYMVQIPRPVTPPDGNCDQVTNQYVYTPSEGGGSYRLDYCIGSQVGSMSPGLLSATPSGTVYLAQGIFVDDALVGYTNTRSLATISYADREGNIYTRTFDSYYIPMAMTDRALDLQIAGVSFAKKNRRTVANNRLVAFDDLIGFNQYKQIIETDPALRNGNPFYITVSNLIEGTHLASTNPDDYSEETIAAIRIINTITNPDPNYNASIFRDLANDLNLETTRSIADLTDLINNPNYEDILANDIPAAVISPNPVQDRSQAAQTANDFNNGLDNNNRADLEIPTGPLAGAAVQRANCVVNENRPDLWTPNTNTICSGVHFIQETNCHTFVDSIGTCACDQGVCYTGCTPNCTNKCNGASNGCGGTCEGTVNCSQNQVCNNNTNTCCTPDQPQPQPNSDCRTDLFDNCGQTYQNTNPLICQNGLSCSTNGQCDLCNGNTCQPGDICQNNNNCCTPSQPENTSDCRATLTDNCGQQYSNPNHYTCESGLTCEESGQYAGQCTCGGNICSQDQTCSNGTCVSNCTPNCGSNNCGSDGCGGSCGTCQSGYTCNAGVCQAPPPDWQTVGTIPIADGSMNLLNSNKALYVTGGNYYVAGPIGSNSQMVVKKFDGSSWSTVGGGYVGSNYYSGFYSLDLEGDDIYIAFQDNFMSPVSVRRCAGGPACTWEDIGDLSFFHHRNGYISLDVENGIPYVAYADYGSGQKPFVARCAGSLPNCTWELVGGVDGVSAGLQDNIISLAVYNNTPYLAYYANSADYPLEVAKCSGGTTSCSWEVLGGSPSSYQYQALNPSLAVYNGTPYVAFQNGNSIAVSKCEGGAVSCSWTSLGNPKNFLGREANYPAIYLDASGVPYVIFSDMSGSGGEKPTVIKYTNSGSNGWQVIGSQFLSACPTNNPSIFVSGSSIYTAFTPRNCGWTAIIRSYTP